MTAWVTVSPRYASAVSFIFCRMKALIWEGACFLPRLSVQASPLSPGIILYGTRSMSFLTMGSSIRRPISRLIAKNVFSGLVTAWRLAAWPTRRSPDSVNATIDGVVRAPSAFSMTFALLPSMTATQELVVPRSMPITLLIGTSCQKQDRSARESTVPIPRGCGSRGCLAYPVAAPVIYVTEAAPINRRQTLARPCSAASEARSVDRLGELSHRHSGLLCGLVLTPARGRLLPRRQPVWRRRLQGIA